MSKSAYIIGTGACFPERVVENEELASKLGLSPEQMFKASGISRRRWASVGTRTSALAAQALAAALDDAKLSPGDIDYLIMGTMTPDRFIPGSATAVQTAASLGQVPCLDIRAACCNGIYAMQLARGLVISGVASNIAVSLAEVQSPWLDLSPESSTISMLFGDGASALIISASARPGVLEVLDVQIASDGQFVDDLCVRGPGTEFGLHPVESHSVKNRDWLPRMAGQSVILQASRRMIASCRAVLERQRLEIKDVRWLVPHQANANLITQVGRGLGFAGEAIIVIEDSGNTSSASMGVALDALRRAKRVDAGDYILMPAFGAGFTWGAALCRAL
jgi:3-oxoacyl-[acyl-carrier-protein] synthase-3